MALRLVTAPAGLPIALDDVKEFLRVEHNDHDALIDRLLAAEVAYAEDFTGLALVSQTWDYWQDAFPSEPVFYWGAFTWDHNQRILLPFGGPTSVEAVYYIDADGSEQTLDVATYDLDVYSIPPRVTLRSSASWPTVYAGTSAVRVRFTTGADLSPDSPAVPQVPKDLELAILLRVQASYLGGDDAQKLRDAAEIYLKRRRIHLGLG